MTAKHYHRIALAGFFGLFSLLMAWPTVLTPPDQLPTALVLLLSVSPLLLPMRGLLAGKARSCAWAAYISLLYFIHGSVEAYANPLQRPYALLEVTFSLMLFVGASLYVRYHKKKP
ncbi:MULTISPECIES: DUF2069 domain-containing protein [Methylotuvimicrobium]|uniref:Transmembrane protein n=2 Tax=Methylotuvimicrobium TaxID=2822410 RepID=G4T247_META2|nr:MULTISPECIES: DUF2069 domain-containing protein [Methylotuvimicrobium]MBE0437121.1 DUF2069 domain-containing protein [Methylomicrobium sp.]QCW83841.1 DUF2069 domain-containing protein [Methylotuvimicrobium buryatense]CCE22473.1 conserved membrane protein of unknown function [Methylotuvimicrobium alcaliphilum 20Z]